MDVSEKAAFYRGRIQGLIDACNVIIMAPPIIDNVSFWLGVEGHIKEIRNKIESLTNTLVPKELTK